MKKPHLSDFNLDKNSLREQQRKRRRLKPLMILFALLVLIANYYFWLWVRIIIGNWSIFGLFLTLWGILPAVFSYVLLDIFLGRFLYAGLKHYEDAKEKYDKWFLRTQTAFWDALTGRQFEIEVASLLNRSGYSAKVTPASNDKGVDLMLRWNHNPMQGS